MSKFLLLFFFTLPILAFTQKKVAIIAGSGTLLVKNYSGFNSNLGLSYDIKKRTTVYIEYNYASLSISNILGNSIINRLQVGGCYKLYNESTQISALSGFSILTNNDNLILDRNVTLGIDLGFMALFNTNHSFNYGLKLINTYSPSSFGGLMQASFVLNFKL